MNEKDQMIFELCDARKKIRGLMDYPYCPGCKKQ